MVLKLIFWSLILIFIVIAVYIVAPTPISIKHTIFPFVAALAVVSFLLGIALIIITLKIKVKGNLKRFLILTGASVSGFFISVMLHNLIYGMFIQLFGANFWDKFGLADEPFFFLLGIVVFPTIFIFGAIGSIVLFLRTGNFNCC